MLINQSINHYKSDEGILQATYSEALLTKPRLNRTILTLLGEVGNVYVV